MPITPPANPAPSPTQTVLIADKHPLFRQALKQVINQIDPQCSIIETESLEQTINLLSEKTFSLLLVDFNMNDCHEVNQLVKLSPFAQKQLVAVITPSDSAHTLSRIVDFNFSGYLLKSMPTNRLLFALKELLANKTFFVKQRGDYDDELNNQREDLKKLQLLTPKQKHVLALISQGFLNKQIANEMNIKETTVKTHISEIFRKLGISNRVQAAMYEHLLTSND